MRSCLCNVTLQLAVTDFVCKRHACSLTTATLSRERTPYPELAVGGLLVFLRSLHSGRPTATLRSRYGVSLDLFVPKRKWKRACIHVRMCMVLQCPCRFKPW